MRAKRGLQYFRPLADPETAELVNLIPSNAMTPNLEKSGTDILWLLARQLDAVFLVACPGEQKASR